MKQVLDAAGIRTPRHVSATTVAGVWEAAERIGYPAHRQADRRRRLGRHLPGRLRRASSADVLPMLRHVPEVSVEEFIDGEEFTYDTVCANGNDPLRERLLVPPAAAADAHARVDQPGDRSRCATSTVPDAGRRARDGRATCCARWASAPASRTWSGTARPTARWCSARSARGRRARGSVDLMNYASDGDLLRRLGRGRGARAPRSPSTQKYNAGSIFKRAHGAGPDHRSRRARRSCWPSYGEHVVRRRPAADRRAAPRLARHASSATAGSSCGIPNCSG